MSTTMIPRSSQYPYLPYAKPRSPKYVTYYEDTVDEFFNLLTSETYVDLKALRRLSRYGIPAEMRSMAWKFLLGAERDDRSDDMVQAIQRKNEYLPAIPSTFEQQNKVLEEVRRSQRRFPKPLPTTGYENVIGAYIQNHPTAIFTTEWVHLCTPFLMINWDRTDVYHCFKKLVEKLNREFEITSLHDRVVSFQLLFRRTLPDLYDYFESEEVSHNEWMPSWIGYLLARQMDFDNLLYLWDFYFSDVNFMETHRFFCLAILKQYRDVLEDATNEQLRTFLRELPPMDIFMIRQLAIDLQYQDRADFPVEYDDNAPPVIAD